MATKNPKLIKGLAKSPVRSILVLASTLSLLLTMNPAYAHGTSPGGPQSNSFSTNYSHLPSSHFSTVPPNIVHGATSQALSKTASTFQLDLGSGHANIVLGNSALHGANSVTINVAGQSQAFQAGAHVTAAEFVAIAEVLSSGSQSLQVGNTGAAAGGSFSLNSVLSPRVSELVVPKSVTALDYFSTNHTLGITGDLINYGSIYGVSTNHNVSSGTLFATNITNETGALISTQLPSSLASLGAGNALSSVSLTLAASNNIVNSGKISSSGSLTLTTANGSISNTLGSNGAIPVIKAANDVNLVIGNGTLNNSGLVKSLSGNINISTPQPNTDLNINAAGTAGTFLAANDINLRDAAYSGAANLNLVAGNYLSQNLNLYSGTGLITANVGQVSGTVNSYGGTEHVLADASNLTLGDTILSGDPTFTSTGNLTVTGLQSFSASMAYLAQGSITGTNAQFVTKSATDSITLIAGATLTTVAGVTTVTFTPTQGGNIVLTSSTGSPIIDTHQTTAGSNGGNVLLVAHASSSLTAATGQITLPAMAAPTTTAINTSSIFGTGGSVTIIAGGNPTVGKLPSIQLGNISTGGTTGGTISITTAQPTITGTVKFDSTGANVGGGSISAGATNVLGTVTTGYLNSSGTNGLPGAAGAVGGAGGAAGAISVTAGTSISTGNLLALGGGGGGGGGGAGAGAAGAGGTGGAGNNINLTTIPSLNNTILVYGSVNASGGGGGGGGGAGTGAAGAGAAGGLSGSVTFVVPFTSSTVVTGSMLAADGGTGGTGGAASGGGGGGGGGAFGAGGGGGGGGLNAGNNGAGGGGGAGFNYGGGGGGGGNAAAAPSTGGAGGGFSGGGAGGTDGLAAPTPGASNGAPGNAVTGGTGGTHGLPGTGASGGTSLGLPGSGALTVTAGANGTTVPGFNGTTATLLQNGDINIGGSGITVGTTTRDTFDFGGSIILPTPFMGSGILGLNQNITGTNSISIAALGTNSILQFNNTTLATPTLSLQTNSGNIGTASSPIVTKNTTLAGGNSTLDLVAGGTTGSAFVNDTSTGSITFQGSNSVGRSGILFVNAPANTAAMNTGGGSSLQGGNIVLNSNNNIGALAGFPTNALQIVNGSNITAQALTGSVYLSGNNTALTLQSSTVGATTFTNTSRVDFELANSNSTTNTSPLTAGTSGVGILNFAGPSLTNNSTMTGPTVTINLNSGTGSLTNTGTISATSAVTGNLTITAQNVSNSGTTSLLSAVETLSITGNAGSALIVTNAGTITGTSNTVGVVALSSAAGQNLTVNNSGTITANGNAGSVIILTATTGGDLFVGGNGTMQAPNVAPPGGPAFSQVIPILLQATPNATAASFVEFTGGQSFVTQAATFWATDPAFVTAANYVLSEIPNLTVMVQANGVVANANMGQSIIFDSSAQVIANNSLTLNSLNIALNGISNVSAGQPLNYDFFANPAVSIGAGSSYGPNLGAPGYVGNATVTGAGNLSFGTSAGLINISQFESLTVVAGGNITWTTNPTFVNFVAAGGQGGAVAVSSPANTIDLSNSNAADNTGNGGNLTLIAGFNFNNTATPTNNGAANNSFFPGNITQLGGPSPTGGSILLPGINITLSTSVNGRSGGNLIAIAYGQPGTSGGANATGLVELGAIDTRNTVSAANPTGRGGFVQIIGSQIDVGAIQTNGPINTVTGAPTLSSTGTVSIVSAVPQQLTDTQVGRNGGGGNFTNSSLLYGGFQVQSGTVGASTITGAGNIGLNGPITAQGSNVTIVTGATGSVTNLPISPVTTNQLTVAAGTGGIGTLSSSFVVATPILQVNATGNVYVSDGLAPGISLNASGGANFQITNPLGNIIVSQPISATNVVLTAGSNGSINLSAQIAGVQAGTDAASVTLNANQTGAINDQAQGVPTIGTSILSLTSGSGTIGSLNQQIQTDATTLQASSNNSIFINDVNSAPVTLLGSSVGSVAATNSFVLNTSGNLTVQGQVTGTNVTFNVGGALSDNVSPIAHNLTLNAANGNVSLPSATGLTLQADSSGNGGSIIVSGYNLLVLGQFPGTQTVFFNASGNGSGNGGTVSLVLASSAPIIVGPPTVVAGNTVAGNIVINATSGPLGGNGGNVTVSNGGNLTVNPLQLLTAPATIGTGNGANITLIAGNNGGQGNLVVSGALSANGVGINANGGNITLASNSTTAMNIGLTGAANTNGLQGALTVTSTGAGNNGNVSITNSRGAVTYTTATPQVSTASITSGGTGGITISAALGTTTTSQISLTALGSGNITGAGPLIAGASNGTIALSSALGTIGTATAPLTIKSNFVTANAPGNVLGNAPGAPAFLGLVNLVDAGGSTFAFSGSTAINNNMVNVTNTIGLAAGTTVTGTGIPVGTTITSIVPNTSITLSANATATSASVALTQTFPIIVGPGSSSAGGTSFTLSAANNIVVRGSITAVTAVTIKSTAANGSLTVNAPIATTGSTSTVTLTATGVGNISGNQSEQVTSATVSLNAGTGNFGSAPALFQIAANNLSESSTGSAFVNNTAASLSFTGNTVNNSNAVNVANTSGLFVGSEVFASGIPVGTTITAVVPNTFFTGGTTGGSPTVTVANTTGLVLGAPVTGPGIPAGTTITAIGKGSITLSNNAASTASAAILQETSAVILSNAASLPGITSLSASQFTLTLTNAKISPTGTFLLESGTAANPAGAVNPGGNITATGAPKVGSYITMNTLTGGNITLQSALGATGATGTSLVTLFTGGVDDSGAILEALPTGAKAAAPVAAAAIVLTSAGGVNIEGPSAGNFLVNTASLTANAPVSAGPANVLLNDSSTAPVTLGNSSGQSFFLQTAASTTVNDIATFGLGALTTGNLTVTSTAGTITTQGAVLQSAVSVSPVAGAVLLATNGGVLVQNTNAAGNIVFGNNSVVETTGANGGAIGAFIGTVQPGVNTTPPLTGVQVNILNPLFKVFFGANATNNITALTIGTTPNTLTTNGQTITFNTAKPAQITLNGNVQMTADPAILPAVLVSSASSENASALASPANSGATNSVRLGTSASEIGSSLPVLHLGSVNPLSMPQFTSGSTNALEMISGSSQTLPLLNASSFNSSNAMSSVAQQATQTTTANSKLAELLSQWASDTELVTGQIPAVLSSECDLGIQQEATSTVDLQEKTALNLSTGAASIAEGAFNSKVLNNAATTNQLSGSITRNASEDRMLTLTRGSVVFAPNTDTSVETPFGNVRIKAHSLVLVMALSNAVAVYDLDDLHTGSVAIESGDSKVLLNPGKVAVITNSSVNSFEEVNPAQLVGYRQLSSGSLSAKHKLFSGEFSAASLISTVIPIKQLMNSKHPQAKKVAEHLLKTTAVMTHLHGSDNYHQILRANLTAWQN